MVALPRTCPHCKASLMHYGHCDCPDGILEMIDEERKTLLKRILELDELERTTMEKQLRSLGVIK